MFPATAPRAPHPRRASRRVSFSPRRGGRDEGSVIILALVYLVAVSIAVLGLCSWVANNLGNVTKFASARQLQEASRSATEVAIQSIRYNPLLGSNQTLNANPPNYCWGSGGTSQLTIDGYTINVYCSTAWYPTLATTRIVTFSACQSMLNGVAITAAQCAAQPYLRAQVTFDDYPPGGAAPVDGSCQLWSWCGEGMTVNSWAWA